MREVMKLWLLRPVDGDRHWEPWYDKAFGFVVRAETEEDARRHASDDEGDEGRDSYKPGKHLASPWLSGEHSTCVELMPDGESGVVLREFHSA